MILLEMVDMADEVAVAVARAVLAFYVCSLHSAEQTPHIRRTGRANVRGASPPCPGSTGAGTRGRGRAPCDPAQRS
eukprot:scaffold69269_cov63-Phaeocystis_antarctica.AAC.2